MSISPLCLSKSVCLFLLCDPLHYIIIYILMFTFKRSHLLLLACMLPHTAYKSDTSQFSSQRIRHPVSSIPCVGMNQHMHRSRCILPHQPLLLPFLHSPVNIKSITLFQYLNQLIRMWHLFPNLRADRIYIILASDNLHCLRFCIKHRTTRARIFIA